MGVLPLEINLYPNLLVLSTHSNIIEVFIPTSIGGLFAICKFNFHSHIIQTTNTP